MTRYEPRLRVDIAHGYYADGRARRLRLCPCTQTAEWLRAHDAVWRETGSGLELSAPEQTASEPSATLTWWARSDDPLWSNITEAGGNDLRWLPCLRAQAAARAGGPTVALHAGPTVSADALRPLDIPGVLAGFAEAQPQPQRPLFVLQLPAPDLQGHPPQGARYRAAFAARALPWQYRLMGDWPGADLRVEDVSPGVEDAAQGLAFDPPADLPLASGLKVPTIRSQQPIALQERPERRFQLRSRAPAADRVLIKRLPMAGAEQFVRETIGDLPTLVSEIFVHR